MGLQWLSNLRWLSLCWCCLAHLPPQLAALSALRELHLGKNGELQVMAGGLRGMPGLTRLSLDERTAQHITAVEWVQLSRAWPSMELTFGNGIYRWQEWGPP